MKRYLSEIIGSSYQLWGRRKILISAPTGLGKSTFVIRHLVKDSCEKKRKSLILCNRSLLRKQYWDDARRALANDLTYVRDIVDIKTYQELASELRKKGDLAYLQDYEHVVCDEAHYFYSDSDFNAFGTYPLLMALIYYTIGTNVVFLSATINQIKPYIERYVKEAYMKRQVEYDYKPVGSRIVRCGRLSYGKDRFLDDADRECGECIFISADYSEMYDHIKYNAVPDLLTLADKCAITDKKSIIFIDNKDAANELKGLLVEAGIRTEDITLLNADNLDSECNKEVVEMLTLAHKVEPKVLITTSVLDNGVSVHDASVGIIGIITENKTSFIQMLGRIRGEESLLCELYLLIQPKEYYKNCVLNIKRKIDAIANNQNSLDYVYRILDETDAVDIYRALLIPFGVARPQYWLNISDDSFSDFNEKSINSPYGIYGLLGSNSSIDYRQLSHACVLVRNILAEQKIKIDLQALEEMYSLALKDPIMVVREKLSWIGKKDESINLVNSSAEDRLRQYILDSVNGCSSGEFSSFKKLLVGNYWHQIKRLIPSECSRGDRSISNDKFEKLCEKLKLVFDISRSQQSTNKYYVKEADAGLEEK